MRKSVENHGSQKISDLVMVRCKSIDSFFDYHADESLVYLTEESSREAYVTPGLARTKTLRNASVNKFRGEEFCGSLPQHEKHNIPIVCYNFSEHTQGEQILKCEIPILDQRVYSFSVSSVEEATELRKT